MRTGRMFHERSCVNVSGVMRDPLTERFRLGKLAVGRLKHLVDDGAGEPA